MQGQRCLLTGAKLLVAIFTVTAEDRAKQAGRLPDSSVQALPRGDHGRVIDRVACEETIVRVVVALLSIVATSSRRRDGRRTADRSAEFRPRRDHALRDRSVVLGEGQANPTVLRIVVLLMWVACQALHYCSIDFASVPKVQMPVYQELRMQGVDDLLDLVLVALGQ